MSQILEILKHEEIPVLLLNDQEALIEAEILTLTERLSRVRHHLIQSKRGIKIHSEIIIKTLPTVTAASMRLIVPGYDNYFNIVPKMEEYMKSVGAVTSKPAYCFSIYHDGEYKDSDIDVEICEAVEELCTDSEKVKFKTIEGIEQAACMFHKGSYSTIPETYSQLYSWINQNGFTPSGNPRESYIDGKWNKNNPEEWLTEVQVPISKGGING